MHRKTGFLVYFGLDEGRESPQGVEDVTEDPTEFNLDPKSLLQGDDELHHGERVEFGKVAVQSRFRTQIRSLVLHPQGGHHDRFHVVEDCLRDLGRASHGVSPHWFCSGREGVSSWRTSLRSGLPLGERGRSGRTTTSAGTM